MRPITVTVGPLVAASATNIRTASAFLAGTLVLNGSTVSGGVATLDAPRRVLLTFAADETGKSFVVTGTNWSGQTISETVAGNASTAGTILSFKTVISVTASANGAGNLSIGTNALADSPWVMLDSWAYGPTSVTVTVVGTVNYDIEISGQDPNSPTDPVAVGSMVWFNCADSGLVNQTANASGSLASTPVYARVTLNSGTGTVAAVFIQPGVVPK